MTTTRVHVIAEAAGAELVVDTMWSAGAVGIEEQSSEPTKGQVVLIGAFQDRAAAQSVADRWSGSVECVEDAAGLDEWRKYATPISAGRWTLVPEWLAIADHGDASCITIDPGRTFGSGSHVSTRMLLELMDDVVSSGDCVVDLGCGSGVLSIAAARVGASAVVPVDIDLSSVEATSHNVALNSVSNIVGPVATTLPDGIKPDVVLANMLSRDITPLLQAVNSALLVGGRFVTAGHLISQRDSIISMCEELSVIRTISRDDWSALIFTKPGHQK